MEIVEKRCYTVAMSTKMTEQQQIDWHSGFAGGLGLGLRKYKGIIEIPLQIVVERTSYLSML